MDTKTPPSRELRCPNPVARKGGRPCNALLAWPNKDGKLAGHFVCYKCKMHLEV